MFGPEYPVPRDLIIKSDAFAFLFQRMNNWYERISRGHVELPIGRMFNVHSELLDLCDDLRTDQCKE